jgi:formylglycine-generating enzyme required for sulfatase activity
MASIGVLKRVSSDYLRMGSRFHPREDPPRTVYVAEFSIAQAPVTVYQYAAFINNDAVDEKRWWSESGWAWLQGELDGWGRENRNKPDGWEVQRLRPYHPVVGVTYFEVEAYCAWVSDQRKSVVRLPSEEEWEHAARGEDWRPFPWGEEFVSDYANTLEGGRGGTADVASIPNDVSPFGVLDMAGNVQEWTASAYKPLSGEVYPPGMLYVARGGSFNDTAYGARTSYRRAYPPGYFYPYLGFRVVVGHR